MRSATSRLAQRGTSTSWSGPGPTIDTSFASASNPMSARETSLATIRSHPLRRQLGPGVGQQLLGLRREPDDGLSAAALDDLSQDVGIADQFEGHALGGLALEF